MQYQDAELKRFQYKTCTNFSLVKTSSITFIKSAFLKSYSEIGQPSLKKFKVFMSFRRAIYFLTTSTHLLKQSFRPILSGDGAGPRWGLASREIDLLIELESQVW